MLENVHEVPYHPKPPCDINFRATVQPAPATSDHAITSKRFSLEATGYDQAQPTKSITDYGEPQSEKEER